MVNNKDTGINTDIVQVMHFSRCYSDFNPTKVHLYTPDESFVKGNDKDNIKISQAKKREWVKTEMILTELGCLFM